MLFFSSPHSSSSLFFLHVLLYLLRPLLICIHVCLRSGSFISILCCSVFGRCPLISFAAKSSSRKWCEPDISVNCICLFIFIFVWFYFQRNRFIACRTLRKSWNAQGGIHRIRFGWITMSIIGQCSFICVVHYSQTFERCVLFESIKNQKII